MRRRCDFYSAPQKIAAIILQLFQQFSGDVSAISAANLANFGLCDLKKVDFTAIAAFRDTRMSHRRNSQDLSRIVKTRPWQKRGPGEHRQAQLLRIRPDTTNLTSMPHVQHEQFLERRRCVQMNDGCLLFLGTTPNLL